MMEAGSEAAKPDGGSAQPSVCHGLDWTSDKAEFRTTHRISSDPAAFLSDAA